ncbi:hypothetical protein [Desulfonatronovibrio magnus]|uniref:hypothetical protein n=1 Tax=Desulfonatronovibrio magnus TaxID=698827 RepID=UPI0005EB51FC|nr:hypothetical protein [Desulfonatronovibrio magnus]
MKIKITALMLLSFLCLAMSGAPGMSPSGAANDRLFRATIIDEQDNTFDVQNLSAEGSTHLKAQTGAAEASIDFGKVKLIRLYLQDEKVLAKLHFLNDDVMDFYIQPDTTFVGLTDWGRVSFQARDLKEIQFR